MEVLLYSEINILCIVLLSIMAITAVNFGIENTAQKRSFVATIWSACAMNLADIFWKAGLSRAIAFPVWAMYCINIVYFSALALTAFFWFVFSLYLFKRKMPHNAFVRIIMGVPLLLLLILLVTTPFNGWLFKFDENFVYTRGPLYYAQSILAFSYVLIAAITTFLHLFTKRDSLNKDQYYIMFSFFFSPIVCGALQLIFQDLPILSVFPVIAFLLVYTGSLKLQISLDPLTGIYNRRELLKELSYKVKNTKKDKTIYFLFLDIDNFKLLNDMCGHYEGDRALQIVADSLDSICYRTGFICARYGGDEFALVCEIDENKDISRICDSIKKYIDKRVALENFVQPVSVSIGYAEIGKDEHDIKTVIDFADKQMYSKKAKLKKEQAENDLSAAKTATFAKTAKKLPPPPKFTKIR